MHTNHHLYVKLPYEESMKGDIVSVVGAFAQWLYLNYDCLNYVYCFSHSLKRVLKYNLNCA